MSVRAWIRACRPCAHAQIAPPIALGQAFACVGGAEFDAGFALLAFAFGLIDHLAIVFVNDYADRHGDALHDAPTPFSGGSRVLQRGELAPRQLGLAGVFANVALLLLGALGALFGRPHLFAFALIAVALSVAYSVRPIALSARGGGELLQGLGVGAVLPLVGYYLQRGDVNDVPWVALGALVLLGAASNVATALPDVSADRRASKRTWPVRVGTRRARMHALLGLSVGCALIVALAPRGEAIALPAVIGVAVAAHQMRRADARPACIRFVAAIAGTITILQIAWTIALARSA